MSTPKVLVIANRTADSPDLIALLRGMCRPSAPSFTLLVPAVPRGLAWAADMKAGWSEAIERADVASRRLRLAGIPIAGAIVGDPDPFAAAGDALHADEYAAIVVSTLPRSVSRWLRLGLAERLRRTYRVDVTRIVARPAAAALESPPPVGVAA